jgi:hypothetical protein
MVGWRGAVLDGCGGVPEAVLVDVGKEREQQPLIGPAVAVVVPPVTGKLRILEALHATVVGLDPREPAVGGELGADLDHSGADPRLECGQRRLVPARGRGVVPFSGVLVTRTQQQDCQNDDTSMF